MTDMRPLDTAAPGSLAGCLSTVEHALLNAIPPAQAARVRRRIVDNESLSARLEVAAFNSAP